MKLKSSDTYLYNLFFYMKYDGNNSSIQFFHVKGLSQYQILVFFPMNIT